LGTSSDESRSVWLSSTTAGNFRLDSAQGNETVDSWSKTKRGLRLSFSPNVSNGNGGTHKLYNSDDCLLDTQNQKGGIVFPPNITRPPSFRPANPVTPTIPALPNLPAGVLPPIGALPPGTLTPTMPTMPHLPGGVVPPIGKLPPGTLTPTMPSKPELPGGVVPPIGTLPPGTLTPTVPSKPDLPGGVVPPIGTLPPGTLPPTVPTQPELPGGVVPPIGTLPPETLAPATGLGKTQGELNGVVVAAAGIPNQPCRGQRPEDASQVGQLSDCYTPSPELQSGQLPMTAGRELVEKSQWNVWVDGSATRSRDTRDGMDTRGNSSSFSMGVDRVVNDDLVAGLQMSVSQAKSSSFDDAMQNDSTSYSVGPYVSYSLADNWLLYGSLGFGKQSVDKQLLNFSGTSDSIQYSLSLQTEGQYAFGSAFIRPKAQLSYTHNEGDAYQLKGVILNRPLTVNMRNQSFNYGVVQTSVELNQTFDLGSNRMVMPFVEAGVYYEYARPGSGQHLTSDLSYADSSPWGGVVRAGARSLIGKSTMASFDVANQTVGVNDVNIWEVRLLISHSF
jgi:outer membrane autotransporter protein